VRFHTYTAIENWRKYKDAIPVGVPVRLTEKIHGSCSRVGLINGEYMCGSHKTVLKPEDKNGRPSVYWKPLTADMKTMLSCISNGSHNTIVFGEIYGSKIQFMDYGIAGNDGYQVFDISIDGEYLPWNEIVYYTTRFCIPRVPLLYEGPFSQDIVEQLVDGPTTVVPIEEVHCDFKGREGVVITPLEEEYSSELNGRLILKAVSVDYLAARKSDSH
jgi:RNA ligase (TIGR02306 family)